MTDALFPAEWRELAPGAVHLPGWLDLDAQRDIVARFIDSTRGPVPIRAATLPGGHQMSAKTVCLGWHWQPHKYTRTAGDVNGALVLEFPDWLAALASGRINITMRVTGLS